MPRSLDTQGAAYASITAERFFKASTYLRLDLPGGTVYLSDSTDNSPAGGGDWRPIVVSWSEVRPVLVPDEGVPEAQALEVVVWNGLYGGSRFGDLVKPTDNVEGATATMASYVRDAAGELPLLPFFQGELEQVTDVTEHEVHLTLTGRVASLSRELDRLVRNDYPQAPPSASGRIQQLAYGVLEGIPLIPVDVGLVAQLDADIDDVVTSLVTRQEIAHWPTSGVLQVGDNELVSFTGLDANTRTLSGLTRAEYGTTARAHVAGEFVILRPASYKFLVADRAAGAVVGVDELRLGGQVIPSSLWSFDPATNLVTITPGGGESGQRVLSKVEAFSENVGGIDLVAGQIMPSKHSGDPKRPILNGTHANLAPYTGDTQHVWPVYSGRRTQVIASDDEVPGAGDAKPWVSTVELRNGVTKTWASSTIDSHLPDSSIFTFTGFRVHVALTPSVEAVRRGTNLYPRIRNTRAKYLHCDVNGVRRTFDLGTETVFSAPDAFIDDSFNGNRISQMIPFDFGTDVDPAAAPHTVSLTIETDGPAGELAAFVESITQGPTGYVTHPGTTGVAPAVEVNMEPPSAGGDPPEDWEWTNHARYDFGTHGFSAAVLGISALLRCDYLKVQAGGQVARIFHNAFSRGIGRPSPIEASITASMLLKPVPQQITVTAHNVGGDGTPIGGSGGGGPSMAVQSARMIGIEVTGATYPLLTPRMEESAWLLAFGEYPVADVRGYAKIGAPSTVAEEPPDVIRHYLENVLGQSASEVDDGGAGDTSFGATRAALQALLGGAGYKFAGLITEQEDARMPAVRMARQCRSWLFWDAFEAQWKLVFRKTPTDLHAVAPADWTWDKDDFTAQEVHLDRPGVADLVDVVRVRYLRDWTSDGEAFGDVKESGSGTKTRDERYVADFVRSPAQAQDLADFYHAWDSVPRRRTQVVTWLAGVEAQKGDVVDLTVQLGGGGFLQGIDSDRWLVVATGFRPGSSTRSVVPALPVILEEVP